MQLKAAGMIYPCGCTRKEIADSLLNAHARNTTLAYPGTCRDGLHGKPARAWRLRVPDGDTAVIAFDDRWQGKQMQNLATEVGDFVLKRADDQWAYQLAVVVDDADAGITHIVRGADLMDSTARQIYLQRCLGVPTPALFACARRYERTGRETQQAERRDGAGYRPAARSAECGGTASWA